MLKASFHPERERTASVMAEPSASATSAGASPDPRSTANANVVEVVNSPSPYGSLIGKTSPTITSTARMTMAGRGCTTQREPDVASTPASVTAPPTETAARYRRSGSVRRRRIEGLVARLTRGPSRSLGSAPYASAGHLETAAGAQHLGDRCKRRQGEGQLVETKLHRLPSFSCPGLGTSETASPSRGTS